MDHQRVRRSLAMWVGGWILTDDSPYLLPHLPPGTVSLSLRGGSGPNDPPARKLADVLDTTIRVYGKLWTVIYTDGSAVGGIKHEGSSAVVTSGDSGNPTF
jgi:hypothetical protein